MMSAAPHLPAHRLPLLITGITGVAGYNALHYFRRRYPGRVFGVAYNHAGSRIAAGSSSDGTGEVRVYTPRTARSFGKLKFPKVAFTRSISAPTATRSSPAALTATSASTTPLMEHSRNDSRQFKSAGSRLQ